LAKFAKDALIRLIKLGGNRDHGRRRGGFLFDHLSLMLVALFAMGTHSALFGPVKYSILPQALREEELVGGNGLVEMGTFLAILAGTIGAGIMMSSTHYAPWFRWPLSALPCWVTWPAAASHALPRRRRKCA
jgi:MFS family permease